MLEGISELSGRSLLHITGYIYFFALLGLKILNINCTSPIRINVGNCYDAEATDHLL